MRKENASENASEKGCPAAPRFGQPAKSGAAYNTRQSLGGVGPQLVHVLGKHSLVFFLAGQGAKYNRTIREYFESVDCYILY